MGYTVIMLDLTLDAGLTEHVEYPIGRPYIDKDHILFVDKVFVEPRATNCEVVISMFAHDDKDTPPVITVIEDIANSFDIFTDDHMNGHPIVFPPIDRIPFCVCHDITGARINVTNRSAGSAQHIHVKFYCKVLDAPNYSGGQLFRKYGHVQEVSNLSKLEG